MRQNERGFSFLEIMITVTIVGILAAIAIPNYQKSLNIQKQNQAKANLVSLAAAEKTFYAQFSTESSRLDEIGWHPTGLQNYGFGFTADKAGPLSEPPYNPLDKICYDTVKKDTTCVAGFTAKWQNASSAVDNFSKTSFPANSSWLAFARANLGSKNDDEWTIDSTGDLINTSNGL